MNEDPTEKLIRELQEENEKLKQMLESGGVVVPKGDGEGGIEEDDNMTEEGKLLRGDVRGQERLMSGVKCTLGKMLEIQNFEQDIHGFCLCDDLMSYDRKS